MKLVPGMLLLFCLLAPGFAQDPPARPPSGGSIGLPIGSKAPAFAAHDQLGREQTYETLKRPNGTVLLFFRSADW